MKKLIIPLLALPIMATSQTVTSTPAYVGVVLSNHYDGVKKQYNVGISDLAVFMAYNRCYNAIIATEVGGYASFGGIGCNANLGLKLANFDIFGGYVFNIFGLKGYPSATVRCRFGGAFITSIYTNKTIFFGIGKTFNNE